MPTRLVVADTGPINYLVLIDTIDVLPRLFEQILVPVAVYDELAHVAAPAPVRAFIARKPTWLEVRPNPDSGGDAFGGSTLEAGEWAAIELARSVHADLLLMDDRAAVAVAYRHGLTVTGTLGVLDLAARRGLVDLPSAFEKLRGTNFRYPPEIMEALLAEHRNKTT